MANKPGEANFFPDVPQFPSMGTFQPVYGKFDLTTYIQGASDYEIMSFLVGKYNACLEAYGNITKLSTDTITACKQLQDWINSWFTNLDVQEELNNKIDSMVADGSFETLLHKTFDTQINQQTTSAVTAWLVANVTPTGSAVVVDKSLSIDGAAADAKVTGRYIDPINRNIELNFQYNGYINNNGELSDSTAPGVFKSTDFIEVSDTIIAKGKLKKLTNTYHYINCYDLNKNFIGGVLSGQLDNTDVNLDGAVNLLDNTCFIRVTTSSDGVNLIKMQYYLIDTHTESKLFKKLEEVNNVTGDRNIALNFQYDGYINNNGELSNAIAPGVFKSTDFIEVSDTIIAKGKFKKLNNSYHYINCYDVNKNFIGGVLSGKLDGTSVNLDGAVNLLDNTCFIRVTTSSDGVNLIKMQYYLIDTHTESKLIQKIKNEYNSFDMNDGLGFTVFSKFASVGDSLSVGYHTQKNGTPISKDLSHSWGAYIEKRTGAKSFWTGASGQTCKSWLQTTSDTWGLNYCKSIGAMPLYVICMGANETGIPIGTTSDIGTDSDTLYSYVSKVIKELRLISPKSFIVCTGVSRKQDSPDINNVYKTICDLTEKCYYLDCFKEFNSGTFTSYYFESHYSANGYSIMASLFDYKLKQVMANNVEEFKYINEADN